MTQRQRKRRIKQLGFIRAIYEGGVMDLYNGCPCGYCQNYRAARTFIKRR